MRSTALGGAASRPKVGRIVGIFDEETGRPIADAEVIDLYVDAVARTETHGLVELSQFQSRHDSVAIRVRKLGYSDTAFVVMTGPNDTLPIRINLRKAAVALATVVTDASAVGPLSRNMQDFAERKKLGPGRFIGPDKLRKNDERELKDLLLDLGIRPNTRGCRGQLRTFVDGAILKAEPGPLARNYEAIEYYSMSEAPLRWGGTTDKKYCGVLVLWTREHP